MALTVDLISKFVKATNDTKKTKTDSTVYGTTVEYNGSIYVKIDGSDRLTPVSSTADLKADERVIVMIKNHAAIVTGNVSSPSASTSSVKDVGNKVTDVEILVANKVDTDVFVAEQARVDILIVDNATIKEKIAINEADIDELQANNINVSGKLTAAEADIENLQANKLDVTIANATYATITELDATNANLHNLESTYGDFEVLATNRLDAIDATLQDLDVDNLSAKYANIDFSNIGKAAMEYLYSTSGLIENVVVGDGTITGNLVGVTIKGDLIEGNTVVADKLVIKGEDGLYYKLNTDGVTVEDNQTAYNSLNGSVILAKSITASKISVTDLVAFDATIGGFNITNSSLYSGVKSTVDNTTRGIYLDKDGQMAVGDANNFIKYYKDTDGSYKLAISADSVIFAASGKSIKETIDELEIGGRNLVIGSSAYRKDTPFTNTSAKADATKVAGAMYMPCDIGETYTLQCCTDGVWGNHITDGTGGGWTHIYAYLMTEDQSAGQYTSTILLRDDPANGYTGRRTWTFTVPDNGTPYTKIMFRFDIHSDGETSYTVNWWDLKVERGTKATDWTPPPEDMATAKDVDAAQKSADVAQETASNAESLIKQLSDSITMLVTDGNGTSLMTQTENGWTFSTSDLQAAVDATSEGLDALTNELGSTSSTVSVLQQSVKDLGILAEYIKIGTYEDEPCIELGESDSEFKLRITNTRIMFMEGSGIPAYFTNQSMHIKKAVIEEELQQGGFVWKVRSNGNMGLVWKGGGS